MRRPLRPAWRRPRATGAQRPSGNFVRPGSALGGSPAGIGPVAGAERAERLGEADLLVEAQIVVDVAQLVGIGAQVVVLVLAVAVLDVGAELGANRRVARRVPGRPRLQ